MLNDNNDSKSNKNTGKVNFIIVNVGFYLLTNQKISNKSYILSLIN